MSMQGINGTGGVFIFQKNDLLNQHKLQNTDDEIILTTRNNSNDYAQIAHSTNKELTPKQKAQKNEVNQKKLDEIAEMKLEAQYRQNNTKAIKDFDNLVKSTKDGECKVSKHQGGDVYTLYDKSGKEIKKFVTFLDDKGTINSTFTETPEYNEKGEITKRTTVNNGSNETCMIRYYKDEKLIRKENPIKLSDFLLPDENYSYDADGNLATIEKVSDDGFKVVEYYKPGNSEYSYKDITTYTMNDNTKVYREENYDDEGHLISSIKKENDEITESFKKNADGSEETFETGTCRGFGDGPFSVSTEGDDVLKKETTTIKDLNGEIISYTTCYIDSKSGDKYEIQRSPNGTIYIKNGEVVPLYISEPVKEHEEAKEKVTHEFETLSNGVEVETTKENGEIKAQKKFCPNGNEEFILYNDDGSTSTEITDKDGNMIRRFTTYKDGTIKEEPLD